MKSPLRGRILGRCPSVSLCLLGFHIDGPRVSFEPNLNFCSEGREMSSASSSASPEPQIAKKKSKAKGKAKATSAFQAAGRGKNEGVDPTWAYKPPSDVVLVNNSITDGGEFDWDTLSRDDDLELWLIRVPDTVCAFHRPS